MTESKIKKKVEEYLKRRVSEPITSVLIASNLDEKLIENIIQLEYSELFFISNNLYVNPTLIKNPEILASNLSEVLKIEKNDLQQKFIIRQKRHLEIIRKMSI
jgi:hypothetical protein